MPLPLTVPVVAPAVPLSVTSPVVKPVTASLKTTVKLMGDAPVRSACPTAWSMVTAGGVVSWTMMLKVPVPTLAAASVAVQVTRVVPMGKMAPLVAS